MKRLTLILICILSFSAAAQTIYDLKNQFIVRLTKMVNPHKDSIQKIKLKANRTIHFQNGKTDTLISSAYDRNGNILEGGNYFFKYDSSQKLTFIKFYGLERTIKPYFDSIDLTKGIDTNHVYAALRSFNRTLYDISMQETYKRRKEGLGFYDSTNFRNAHVDIYGQKNPSDTALYISRITFRSYPNSNNKNIIEHVKYDYGYHPPSMEIIKDDTLNKIKQTFCYYSPNYDEKNLDYSYKLHTIYTSKTLKDHSEEIMEDYQGKDDKIFKFPQSIEIRKYYDNVYEYYLYKQTSPKKKKLIE